MSDAPESRPRPGGRLWRLAPIALALAGTAFVTHYYGAHPVQLLFAIPASVDEQRPGLGVRLTRPDGKLVLQVEQPTRAQEGHTVVVQAHLPRGTFHVDAWLQGTPKHLTASLTFDGEDAIEVPLEGR